MRSSGMLVLLAAVATVTGCGRKAASGITVDRAFRPLIAPDTQALAGVELEKLESTPFYKKHESDLTFPMLDAASERIGVDFRRDLSDVLIGWNGKQPVFLVRGRFKPAVVQQKLLTFGARRESYKQYTLLRSDEGAVAFLKGSVAVTGRPATVQAALDADSNGAGAVPEELQERLRTLPRSDQIWEVSRVGLPFTNFRMNSEYASALSNIVGYVQGTSLGISVDTGAAVVADLNCVSQDGAKRVHDGLRAAIALGRLTTKDNEQDLLRIYDTIQVDQENQIVHVRANFPADLADKLVGYLTNLQKRVEQRAR